MRNLQALGAVLRTQRETLGLSLDQVQTQTKIRKRYLTALEAGDWRVLPGDVYARGFVRSYAAALGLDGRELLAQYVDGDPVPSPVSQAAAVPGHAADSLVAPAPRKPLPEVADPIQTPAGTTVAPPGALAETVRKEEELTRETAPASVGNPRQDKPRTEAEGSDDGAAALVDPKEEGPRLADPSQAAPSRARVEAVPVEGWNLSAMTVHQRNKRRSLSAREGRSRRRSGAWPRRRGWVFPGQAAAVVVVLGGLVAAWWSLQRANPSNPEAGHTTAVAPAGDTTGNTVNPGGSGSATGTTADTSSARTGTPASSANGSALDHAAGADSGVTSPAPAAGGNADSGQPQVQVVAQPFANGLQTYVVSGQGPIVVQVAGASAPCWVRAVADGMVVDPDDTVQVGQTRTWQGGQSVRVRLGNAPGVTLTVNGQPVQLPVGQTVLNVLFTKGTMQ
ncbi:MAG: DUF4115 domain-containing protein [Alicyclobacillus sp.]|nr:DUF4115 domain-containing protein [Alicyclobacillus sp.]